MRRSTLRFFLAAGAPLILTACASIAPPQPPSLDLPKPPTDLRASRKGDQVNLTWTIPTITTDRQTIRSLGPTRICRALVDLKVCGTPVAQTTTPLKPSASKTADQKQTASYTDVLPASLQSDTPSTATYAIEATNSEGRAAGLSNHAQVSLIRTLPPPQDFKVQVTGQGIVLSWTSAIPATGSQSSISYVYRVYRTLEGTQERTLAGERPAGSDHRFSLTDSSFEWQKNYEYRAETVTVITQNNKPAVLVEGDDTPAVRVFADDVFPPAVPTGLQAVFSGPGQTPFIDLVWAPVPDVDLAGYNIYRHEEGASPAKLNSDLVKTPAYRDPNVASGKHYLYSVSAVDLRGNESTRSEEAGESVPQ
jgi:hypothetical protein